MIHTPNIERAIHKVAILHRDQVRKGKNKLPYTTHLFSVTAILSEYTTDENILIAGLLHDSIEDTPYTAAELEKDFSTQVLDIVLGITTQKIKDGKKISWIESKREYIRGLEVCPEGSLYVAAADKIHNFSSVLDEYKDDGEAFKKDFSSEDRIRFYEAIVEVIEKRLGAEHALVQKLKETFSRYKTFLVDVYNIV